MDQEETKLEYGLPLPAREKYFFGLLTRSWMVAGRKIASLRNPEPEPPEDLYRLDINLAMEGIRADYLASRSTPTHKGAQLHAIDFLVPVGTPVFAAEHGTVIESVDEHSKFGNTPEFARFANFVTIRHEDGEFSQYMHLELGSTVEARLRVRYPVVRGQQIGRVGMSGQTDRPHLHFLVFRGQLGAVGYQSLKVRWG